MNKLYYNKDGWVCGRVPQNFEIDDENRFIEVDDTTFSKTFDAPIGKSWKVSDGNVVLAVYDAEAVDKVAKEERINELQNLLNETDYVVIKLYEMKLADNANFDSELIRYQETIQNRAAWRSELDRLSEE